MKKPPDNILVGIGIILIALFAAYLYGRQSVSKHQPEISADDAAYKEKLAAANHAIAERLEKEMEITPKDDFCAAWRAEYIGLPIAPSGPEWQKELQQRANGGDTYSQEVLGMYYLFGNHMQQSNEEALKWFQKAATKVAPMAQGYLGKMYFEGISVKVDPELAYFYLSLASIQGQYWSHKLCYAAEKQLTPDTIPKVRADVLKRLKTDGLLK